MTTKATIVNPEDQTKTMLANIFIDSGSHRSFITEAAAAKLQLSALSTETCYLKSFGSPEAKRYLSDRVKVMILPKTGSSITVNMNRMKFLVDSLPIYNLSEMDQKALQKQQVDPASEVTQPDLMLASTLSHNSA